MPVDLADKNLSIAVALQLRRAADSNFVRRRARALESRTLSSVEQCVLGAILVVEASQRPPAIQAAELFVLKVGTALRLPPSWIPRTTGPFQMTSAPSRLDDAAEAAALRLRRLTRLSWHDVAREWHGAALVVPGASISYTTALASAHEMLHASCATGAMLARGSPDLA